jgi:hypothetical protein
LAIELITLVGFAITALAKVYGGRAPSGSIHPACSYSRSCTGTSNPPFFKGETLNAETPVLVEETD